MDLRELVKGNSYLAPDIGSVAQFSLSSAPGTNWVSFQPAVTLDPQVDAEAARRRAVRSEPFSYTRSALLEHEDEAATLTERAGELGQVEQVLRELRPDEGVQQPSARDLRESYRRYHFPG
jgi:hypothetical protein